MLVGDTPRVTNYATSPDDDEVHPSLGGSGSPAVVALKAEAEGLADGPAPEPPADATDAAADEDAPTVPASPAGAPAETAPRLRDMTLMFVFGLIPLFGSPSGGR